jgi:type IV pilus assembly protein PilW
MNSRLQRLNKGLGVIHQCGVTLLELMISLTIGLFLLAGMATIFSSTNISYNAQTGLTQLQNNQVQALTVLSNIIQSAGYYAAYPGNNTASALQTAVTAIPAISNSIVVPVSVGVNSPTAISTTPTFNLNFTTPASSGSYQVQAVFGGSLYSNGPDAIAVRAANAMDCTGNAHSSDLTAVYSVFTVYNNSLICAIYNTNTSAWTNWQVLISGSTGVNGMPNGLSSMSIVYEVDPSGSGQAMQYLTAAAVTTNGYWSNVIGVQLTLKFINPLYVSATATPGQPQTISITRVIGLMSAV